MASSGMHLSRIFLLARLSMRVACAQNSYRSKSIHALPAVQVPTLDQLRAVAKRHRMNVSDAELEEYKAYFKDVRLPMYKNIDKYPDQCLPVKYKSSPGVVPSPAENPYNGWVRITNTVGAPKGKLFGKTVAVKDNVSLAGTPMVNGSVYMKGFVAEYNATVVDRLLDEGAVIKGKAENEDMCYTGFSFSSATGHVRNPVDPSRNSGGSSSGCGVVVAAADVDIAIGTDQGGSVRLPASWCGITAIKATRGLVPCTGVISLDGFVDHVGPMARTVKDLALTLEVIAGWDGGLDHRQPPDVVVKNYSDLLTGNVKGLRVGLLKEGFTDCEPDVAKLVASVAKKLTPRGALVEEFSSPLPDEAHHLIGALLNEGTYHTFCNRGIVPLNERGFKDITLHDFMFTCAKTRADTLPTSIKNLLLLDGYLTENYGARYYGKAANIAQRINHDFNGVFKKYDVIIMPTIKFKAPKLPTKKLSVTEFLHDHLRNAYNTSPYNVTGHPAASVNAGFSEGLPVGLMIVGNHWQDDVILNVAHVIEQIVAS